MGKDNSKSKSIGIIGSLGQIGRALLTPLIKENGRLGIREINLYYRRSDEGEIISGLIGQHAPSASSIELNSTRDLSELGERSDIVIITIGNKEKEEHVTKREELTGVYFQDIADIMNGLGNNPFTLFMATNPVTPNCLVAHLYSLHKNPVIIGFTRADFERANYILGQWIESDVPDLKGERVRADVLGPHGYGLVVTNIRIGSKKAIFSNDGLREIGFREDKTLESLSKDTADYGERIKRSLGGYSTPDYFAAQIIDSLRAILNDKRDTAAININLSTICQSTLIKGLKGPPTYTGFPIEYKNGTPYISSKFDTTKIPERYRSDLLKILLKEERAIVSFLRNNSNGLSKLWEHFN